MQLGIIFGIVFAVVIFLVMRNRWPETRRGALRILRR